MRQDLMSGFELSWVFRASFLASWLTYLISVGVGVSVFLVNIVLLNYASPEFADNSSLLKVVAWAAQLISVNLSDIGNKKKLFLP